MCLPSPLVGYMELSVCSAIARRTDRDDVLCIGVIKGHDKDRVYFPNENETKFARLILLFYKSCI